MKGSSGSSRPLEFSSRKTVQPADRKSTRLNSSHRCISYAVFCLKKKKKDDHSEYTAEQGLTGCPVLVVQCRLFRPQNRDILLRGYTISQELDECYQLAYHRTQAV